MRKREAEKVPLNLKVTPEIDNALRRFARDNEQTVTWALNKLLAAGLKQMKGRADARIRKD